jgi:hypothetical protein
MYMANKPPPYIPILNQVQFQSYVLVGWKSKIARKSDLDPILPNTIFPVLYISENEKWILQNFF